MTAAIFTIELDVVTDHEGTADWEPGGSLHLDGVSARMVEQVGPAGGNPLVELTGTLNALAAWLWVHYTQTDGLDDAALRHAVITDLADILRSLDLVEPAAV